MELNYVKRLCINTENYINTIVPVLEDALDNDTKGLKEILEYLYGKDNTLMVWYEDFENLLLELNKT